MPQYLDISNVFATLERKMPKLLENFTDFTEEQITQIAESDPTKNKQYINWLLLQIQKGNIRLPEDSWRVDPVLKYFNDDKLKKRYTLQYSDINRYQQFQDLEDEVESLTNKDPRTGADVEKGLLQPLHLLPDGAEVIQKQGDYALIKITTEEAAWDVSCGTKWCTKKEMNYAGNYLKDGPLYVIVKGQQKLAQLHISSRQFMDIKDRPIRVDDIPGDITELLTKALPSFKNEVKSIEDIKFISKLTKGRMEEFEPQILEVGSVKDLYEYAKNSVQDRWPEAEEKILTSPIASSYYAINVIGDRWPEAEQIIQKDSKAALRYTKGAIQGRWPEFEKKILAEGDPQVLRNYAEAFIGRWPEAEKVILTNPIQAVHYARDVIKGRWPEAEPYIAEDEIAKETYEKVIQKMSGVMRSPFNKKAQPVEAPTKPAPTTPAPTKPSEAPTRDPFKPQKPAVEPKPKASIEK